MSHKQNIIKLRTEGKTYTEISEIIGCSLSTVSYHCHNTTEINYFDKELINEIQYWTDRKGVELFHKVLKEEVDRQNKLVEAYKEESEKTYVPDPPNFTAGVYKKMSKEEVKELLHLSLSGYGDGQTVWLGSEAYQKALDFKNKMIQKYK
jgi:hypothetical protein